MADIYGSHFEYGGVSSVQYNLIIANINTTRMTRMDGDKKSVTIYSKSSKKRYLIDDDYSESPVSFDIEILTEDSRCLEVSERRRIEKWLFGHHDYRKLYVDISDDVLGETFEYVDGKRLRNYLNCRLINPEKLECQGGVIGYKATLEADSNMYWQDAITKKYIVNNGSDAASTTISLYVDTDIADYTYPKVTIVMGRSGGDILICNQTDDSARFTKFVDVLQNASIVMNGELNYVSGQYYEKFSNRHFIRLLSGENKLTIRGDVSTIAFEYSARRMM